jgi:hypothetical protein
MLDNFVSVLLIRLLSSSHHRPGGPQVRPRQVGRKVGKGLCIDGVSTLLFAHRAIDFFYLLLHTSAMASRATFASMKT